MRLNDRRPLLLSSTVREDNALLTVDLANPDIDADGEAGLSRDTLHIFRMTFLWNQACYSRFRLRNYAPHPVELDLDLFFDADFVDVFEVRGMKRPRRGAMLPPVVEENRLCLGYRGLDDVVRQTVLDFSPPPTELNEKRARFHVSIPARGEQEYHLTIACRIENASAPSDPVPLTQAFENFTREIQSYREADATITTSNDQFNAWLHRSVSDLHLMVTQTPHGPYPYAGVPWFSTAFGRDGLITAFECLCVNPKLAGGVLVYLAATQADSVNPEQDAEPGKILHETRKGEMAALGEIPFGQYYGTVDATPLFIMLAGAYYGRTGDAALIDSIWPNIRRALEWIDRYGDADGDGLIEYARKSDKGLVTQGWKDSFDSVFHDDGTLAEGPIALCEVQGYVYAAWLAAAKLAHARGEPEMAADLAERARRLQERFEQAFWCEDLATYALALDGQNRPCRVRASNAGHALWTGIAGPEHAALAAKTLLHDASFSGWGIRTVAETEARYNPMSYHNGSIWPHDNALVACGLARYGLKHEVQRVLSGMFDASLYFNLHRMPELFCGFLRRPGEDPTLYPVACAPQSWAAGAVFLLLQSCIGLSIDAPARRVCFQYPVLPPSLQHVAINNLRVNDAVLDVALHRHRNDVGINVSRREGAVDVVVVK